MLDAKFQPLEIESGFGFDLDELHELREKSGRILRRIGLRH